MIIRWGGESTVFGCSCLHELGLFTLLFRGLYHGDVLVFNVIVSNGVQVGVELKHEWGGVWDSQVQYLVIIDTGQGLHHASEHVLVSHEKQRFLLAKTFQGGYYLILPVRSYPLSNHFQRFTTWHLFVLLLIKLLVNFSKSGVALIIVADEWWWVVVRLSPLFHLSLAVLGGCFVLAESFQSSIVAFVYFP